jgi:hypothetical protein
LGLENIKITSGRINAAKSTSSRAWPEKLEPRNGSLLAPDTSMRYRKVLEVGCIFDMDIIGEGSAVGKTELKILSAFWLAVSGSSTTPIS